MKLVQECTLTVPLKPAIPVGAGPKGLRMYYEIAGGQVRGDRLNGTVLGGGEWALIGEDGFLRIDVRMQVETDDGAFLYFQYSGLAEMNEALVTALETGEGTDYEDQYFYTNPRVETGDERYQWLNTIFLIGEGRVLPGLGVEYRVWRPE